MTSSPQENQAQNTENKPSDKELNFRALEARYQKALEQEKAEKEKLARLLEEKSKSQVVEEDDEDIYVDHRKLEKKLNKFGQNTQSEIQKAMEFAKNQAKEELKQEIWLENNPDFYDVLQHADKLAKKSPKLAESILRMPEGFERQKLVYQNIKELGIDKPEQKQPSIQEKIDSNRRSPFYQPSGTSSAPYSTVGDFSEQGQKNAYEKMKQLQKQLRL